MGLMVSGLTRLIAEPFRDHGKAKASSWDVLVNTQFTGIAFGMLLVGLIIRWWFVWRSREVSKVEMENEARPDERKSKRRKVA